MGRVRFSAMPGCMKQLATARMAAKTKRVRCMICAQGGRRSCHTVGRVACAARGYIAGYRGKGLLLDRISSSPQIATK